MTSTKPNFELSVSTEAITEVAGIPLRPFLQDPEVMARACAKADTHFSSKYGLRVAPHVPLHGWWSLALLGIEIEWPEDAWPHPVTRLSCAADVANLRLPQPDCFAGSELEPVVRYDQAVQRMTGNDSHLHDGMALGPVTCARTLRGDDFFLDLYEAPEQAHRLLAFATDLHLAFQAAQRAYTGGTSPDWMHIADDFAGMISPAMWPEFVLPYWKRIFEERGVALGCRMRMLHSELMGPAHQELAVAHLPITCIECGEDPHVTLADMNALELEYWWHIKALQMLNGTPAGIRTACLEAAHAGAPMIRSQIGHRQVPHDNICAFLDVKREYA